MYMKRKQLATLSFRFLSPTFSTQFVIKPFFILKIMFLKFQYIKIVQLTRLTKRNVKLSQVKLLSLILNSSLSPRPLLPAASLRLRRQQHYKHTHTYAHILIWSKCSLLLRKNTVPRAWLHRIWFAYQRIECESKNWRWSTTKEKTRTAATAAAQQHLFQQRRRHIAFLQYSLSFHSVSLYLPQKIEVRFAQQKFFSFWNFCSLCRLFCLSLALSRFVLFAQFNRFVCARIPTAARTSFCALSLKKALSHNRFTQFFFCQVCKILLSPSALALRCCSLCIALFGLFAHFYLRSLSLRFRRRAAMSCCCCSLTIWGALSLNCGAFVLLFSSITVSFAALRLFCCFAFCLAFASAAALAWPCCCCRCAAPLLLLVLAPLCHSQKNFIVTGQQRVQRAA